MNHKIQITSPEDALNARLNVLSTLLEGGEEGELRILRASDFAGSPFPLSGRRLDAIAARAAFNGWVLVSVAGRKASKNSLALQKRCGIFAHVPAIHFTRLCESAQAIPAYIGVLERLYWFRDNASPGSERHRHLTDAIALAWYAALSTRQMKELAVHVNLLYRHEEGSRKARSPFPFSGGASNDECPHTHAGILGVLDAMRLIAKTPASLP